MILKFILKLSSAILLSLVLPLHSLAIETEITPDEAGQGDLFLLRVCSEKNLSPEVNFQEKNFRMYSAENGCFLTLIPVEVDTEPGDYGIGINAEGISVSLNVKVKSLDFPTKHITLPDKKVSLSPEDLKRVEKEYFLQEEIWKIDNEKIWGGNFVSPTGTKVSEVYGVKRIMNKKKTSRHRGIDLKGKTGAPVKAINSGKVVLREDLFYGGNTLVVDHGMGLLSVYMHLSKFNVKEGDEVSTGDVIGMIGMTGRATGPHLHMSVKLQGVSINPEALMKLKFE